MKKHWTQRSPYAVARALVEQHNVEHAQAFRFAWYALRIGEHPEATLAQIFSRMGSVRDVPAVSKGAMLMMQANLRHLMRGDSCR